MAVVQNPLTQPAPTMVVPNPLAGAVSTTTFSTNTPASQTFSLFKKEEAMTQVSVASVLETNKVAFKAAARAEVGRIAINTVVEALKPQLPMMVRGYADHALFKIAVANAIAVAIQKFLPTNTKAQLIADAMLVSSHTQLIQSFDLEGLVNGLISKLPGDKLAALEDAA